MSGYRDDLDAALARVAQLEAEANALRGQLRSTPAAQARLADLERRRSDARAAVRAAEAVARWWLKGFATLAAIGVLVFVGAIASMGASGHPLAAALLGLAIAGPLVATVWGLGAAYVDGRRRELGAIEREIADTVGEDAQVRVAPDVRVAVDGDESAAPASEDAADRRRA